VLGHRRPADGQSLSQLSYGGRSASQELEDRSTRWVAEHPQPHVLVSRHEP
jgi:hypothetical protein